ncbi:DinB superfamily protein [Reichenbachiella faecimaris]|uniref:DinB superfamily protein n=1 Tax=Reichenbachiella faecimaris TaxID=692418 RepID=A0A1W2GI32_REIFA|nr:DinB family protein [Reichenbachiella faecimaris]SMD36142.1 DinB superfamily protein [Reichenbachiella faecimaris]
MTEALATQLSQIIETALKDFESISEEQWNTKPAPEKWSKKEILGHLADSAINNIHRFVRIPQGDQTNIWYDQNYWVKASDYEHQDLESIKSLWQSLNLQIVRVWKKTWDADLQKTIPVKDETPTLQFLMEDYIDHLNHHLRQIF